MSLRASEIEQPAASLSATPNPVPPMATAVSISWNTGDGCEGQVRVSVDGGPETLFATGGAGAAEATWIKIGSSYEFRLYVSAEDRTPIATVNVARATPTWETVADGLRHFARAEENEERVAGLLADVLPPFAHGSRHQSYFRTWEERGVHVTPVHFYQPVPDTRLLGDAVWSAPSELPGIDLNVEGQLALLRDAFPAFRMEYDRFPHDPTPLPHDFYFSNGSFSGTDALALYCMIRHFKPELVIEVGSGFSTRIAALAARRNGTTRLVSVEPYPDEVLGAGFPGLSELIALPVQELRPEFFAQLHANDILFLDTSHIVRTGGETNYLFLEILPRLAPGTIVHIHDIFLPREYPRDWVVGDLRFYSEQYLLQAFLAFNRTFEVLLANSFLGEHHAQDLRQCFPHSSRWAGDASFWMRRVEDA